MALGQISVAGHFACPTTKLVSLLFKNTSKLGAFLTLLGILFKIVPVVTPPLVQEKITNCGTKAADVLDKFLAANFKCESTEYFGSSATTMTYNVYKVCCSICYR